MEYVGFFYNPAKRRTYLWWFERHLERAGWARKNEQILRIADGDALQMESLRRSAGIVTPSEWTDRIGAFQTLADEVWAEAADWRSVMERASAKWCKGYDRWIHLVIDERYLMLDGREELHQGISYGLNVTPQRQGFLGVPLREGTTVFGLHEFTIDREVATLRLVDDWGDAFECTDLGSLLEVEREARRLLAGTDDAEYEYLARKCVGTEGPLLHSEPVDLSELTFKYDSEE